MAVVVTRQERHIEPSMRRVLGANKKPEAESANRESPSRCVVAAPMADEPGEDEGDQPNATNPNKVMPHVATGWSEKYKGPWKRELTRTLYAFYSLRWPIQRVTS
jgi:hypothetical protein